MARVSSSRPGLFRGGDLVEAEQEVVLFVNGKEVAREMVQPTLGDLLRTARTPDTALHFHASLRVPAGAGADSPGE